MAFFSSKKTYTKDFDMSTKFKLYKNMKVQIRSNTKKNSRKIKDQRSNFPLPCIVVSLP